MFVEDNILRIYIVDSNSINIHVKLKTILI